MDDKIDWLHFYTFYIKFGMRRALQPDRINQALLPEIGISLFV